AVEWGLVDEAPGKAQFDSAVKRRLEAMRARAKRKPHAPVILPPLDAKRSTNNVEYTHVSLAIDAPKRTATLTVRAPQGAEPETPEELGKVGAKAWAIRAFRELDDALLDLRMNHPKIGVVAVKTAGDAAKVAAVDAMLARHADDGLVREVVLLMKRVLKRLDL